MVESVNCKPRKIITHWDISVRGKGRLSDARQARIAQRRGARPIREAVTPENALFPPPRPRAFYVGFDALPAFGIRWPRS